VGARRIVSRAAASDGSRGSLGPPVNLGGQCAASRHRTTIGLLGDSCVLSGTATRYTGWEAFTGGAPRSLRAPGYHPAAATRRSEPPQRDAFAKHEVCRPSPRDLSGERVAEGRVRGRAIGHTRATCKCRTVVRPPSSAFGTLRLAALAQGRLFSPRKKRGERRATVASPRSSTCP
jgi:hypothetical protein